MHINFLNIKKKNYVQKPNSTIQFVRRAVYFRLLFFSANTLSYDFGMHLKGKEWLAARVTQSQISL